MYFAYLSGFPVQHVVL